MRFDQNSIGRDERSNHIFGRRLVKYMGWSSGLSKRFVENPLITSLCSARRTCAGSSKHMRAITMTCELISP